MGLDGQDDSTETGLEWSCFGTVCNSVSLTQYKGDPARDNYVPDDESSDPSRSINGMEDNNRLVEGGYRLLEASVAAPQGAVPVPDLREGGQYLAGLLLQPLQAALKDKTRLVISPDGALSLLPFETRTPDIESAS